MMDPTEQLAARLVTSAHWRDAALDAEIAAKRDRHGATAKDRLAIRLEWAFGQGFPRTNLRAIRWGELAGALLDAAAGRSRKKREVFRLRPSRERAFLDAARATGRESEGVLEGEALATLAKDVLSFARSRADFVDGFGAASEVLYRYRRGDLVRVGA